ncbi:MAG: hypothetical protein BWY70_01645 [Bacteroidetes bacterium ADurb.Bin408]|nr:MAG: hypothetical protein BWY70_01645 [Bacteroidetes bacterium ADurb.Bin408]
MQIYNFFNIIDSGLLLILRSQTASQLVRDAAQAELSEWLNQIPSGDEMSYGFYNREEFADAFSGVLYKVYLINAKEDVNDLKMFTYNEYRIPVVVKGSYRALLTVSKRDDEWHIIDFGAVKLAREIGEKINGFEPASMYEGVFLRIYGPNCDFIALKNEDDDVEKCSFIPLQSAVDFIQNQQLELKETYDLTSIFSLIKEKR